MLGAHVVLCFDYVAISLPATIDETFAKRELARSNSLAVAKRIGETIVIPPAGNNLRDLYLLARSYQELAPSTT